MPTRDDTMAPYSHEPSSVHGLLGDIRFQLARELPADLRTAYKQLLDRASRPRVSGAALAPEYDRLATSWRMWRNEPQNRAVFAAGFAEALAEQDRQHAAWAEERRIEEEQRAAEEAAREAERMAAEAARAVEAVDAAPTDAS